MTSRRAVFKLGVTVACLFVIGTAVVVFVQSLGPTAVSRRAQEVHVPVSELSTTGLTQVSWRGRNVVLLHGEQPRAYFFPYDPVKQVYLLPDPSWDRPLVPCAAMDFDGRVLRCSDSRVQRKLAWRADGVSISWYTPALESPPYTVEDGTVIIGREHES
jgi:hypothetical protein